jgi:predicted RNase H-like nuclease (RuvC/YqgF family)
MQDGFELLEEKVRKAAELVKRLRKENKSLEEDVTKSKWRVQEAEKRLSALEQQAESAQKAAQQASASNGDAEARAQEIASLKEEREEVRRRVAKLVNVLEGLE